MEKQKRARRRLAQKLRMLRLIKGWSQEDLAGASGCRSRLPGSRDTSTSLCVVHRTYISSIERGERNVGLDNLEKLADAFSFTVDELLVAPDAASFGERLLETLAKLIRAPEERAPDKDTERHPPEEKES